MLSGFWLIRAGSLECSASCSVLRVRILRDPFWTGVSHFGLVKQGSLFHSHRESDVLVS